MASGGGWNALTQLSPVAVNLVLTPFVIHRLGIDRWGLFALTVTITSFLSSFDGGLGSSTQRYFSIYAGKDDRISTTRLLVTLVIGIAGFTAAFVSLCWFLAPHLILLFNVPRSLDAEGAYLLRALIVLVGASFIHNLFQGLLYSRRRYALVNLTQTACNGVWAVGLFLAVDTGGNLRQVAWVFIAQQALAIAMLIPAGTRYLTSRDFHLLSRSELKAFLGFSSRVQMTSLSTVVNNQMDAFVIAAVLPIRIVAFYNTGSNFAFQLRTVLSNGLGPASNVLGNEMGAHGQDRMRLEFRRVLRLWVVIVCGWTAAGIGAAYFGIVAWLGPQFRLGGQVAVLLTAGYAFTLFAGMYQLYASIQGRPGLLTRSALLTVAVNTVLTIPLVFVGPLGVVAATAFSAMSGCLYLQRILHRHLDADMPTFAEFVPIVPVGLCIGVTVALEFLIRPYTGSGALGLLSCSLPAVVGLAAYGVAVLGPRRAADEVWKRVIRRVLPKGGLLGPS
jgi:O-antigen/teichoic acid export membrane protein